MNYKKAYLELVMSRQLLKRRKVKGDYHEKHHILPKCLGGTNDKENLVLLTFREHYIAHLLLTKCYEDINAKRKMIYGLWMNESITK